MSDANLWRSTPSKALRVSFSRAGVTSTTAAAATYHARVWRCGHLRISWEVGTSMFLALAYSCTSWSTYGETARFHGVLATARSTTRRRVSSSLVRPAERSSKDHHVRRSLHACMVGMFSLSAGLDEKTAGMCASRVCSRILSAGMVR